ncbi:ubiquinol-cytochrome c reductase complex protein [Coniella lustricola]|uniref:Cytochrome b-c1 complex subunit 7 n=1 Tax=Coniella lustricola TaxID=2025994 RepID=A0A2T3AHA6_9PEZI|nr:ubiquinol-cytochrome c reductase complex protein [Coniella lustricola]
MSYVTLAPFVAKRPWLSSALKPLANWYANAAGYRQLGLRADDLIPEESETVQTALARLSEKERYDRIFRIRRAVQCSITHRLLPKAEWTQQEEDVPYLGPLIKMVEAELKEKDDLNAITLQKKH